MSFLGHIGEGVLRNWRSGRAVASLVWGVLRIACLPASWSRTVRAIMAKQILFTGIDALSLTVVIAILTGASVVAQAQYWLMSFGQSAMLGPVLVAVVIREAGPLLVNFLVIGRSGTAIATELANMRVRHEIDVLEAQGVDPMVYLVMPRVLGVAASVFGLTMTMIALSLGSGYLLGLFLGVAPGDFSLFANSVLGAIRPIDAGVVAVKTILPGLMTGAICCIEGLCIGGSVTDVPRAGTRGVVRSIAALLVVSTIVSVLTYT